MQDFFNLKGLAELIQEYVNSSNNPLVQDVIRFVQNPSKYNILQPKMGA